MKTFFPSVLVFAFSFLLETFRPHVPALVDAAVYSSTARQTSENGKTGLPQWFSRSLEDYEKSLVDFPLYTKAVTSGVIGGLGDLTAQLILPKSTKRTVAMPLSHLNLFRTFTVFMEGLFFSGPLLHLGYDHFEHLFPTTTGTTQSSDMTQITIASALQTFLDIIVMDSILACSFMLFSGIFQGQTPKRLWYEIKRELLDTVKVSWASSALMSPLQILNFAVVPLRYRVLITNIQDIFWNAAVSWSTHKTRT